MTLLKPNSCRFTRSLPALESHGPVVWLRDCNALLDDSSGRSHGAADQKGNPLAWKVRCFPDRVLSGHHIQKGSRHFDQPLKLCVLKNAAYAAENKLVCKPAFASFAAIRGTYLICGNSSLEMAGNYTPASTKPCKASALTSKKTCQGAVQLHQTKAALKVHEKKFSNSP